MREKLLWIVLLGVIAVVFFYRPLMEYMYPLHYRDVVYRHATQHQLDPLLVTAIMSVESSFNPRAVSSKGAKGLMQLMPPTAEWAAAQMGMEPFSEDMLFDPDINVSIGVWYLANLRRLFDGDMALALAAYNGGRANVLRWLEEETWSGTIEDADDIPFPETRAYVRKVLHRYEWYRRVWTNEAFGPALGMI